MSKQDTKILEIKVANEGFDQRINANKDKCLSLLNYCDNLKETKVNCSDYELRQKEIWEQLMKNNNNLDSQITQLKTIEHFIDRYTPIRVQKQVAENLMSVLS